MKTQSPSPEISTPAYRADELQAAVLARAPRTAVFDCDGTLWAPDSGYGFMQWTLEQGLVAPKRAAWLAERYRLYEAGRIDEAAICGEMVQLYAGLSQAQVRAAAATYVMTHVLSFVFSEMALLVAALHATGTELWAVSSTNRWVVEAAVWNLGQSSFGIPPARILAADVSVDANGLLTDELLAVPTGEAKATALRAAGLAQPDVVFGNSIHDAAMLALGGQAFPINPSPGLREIARRESWRIYSPTPTEDFANSFGFDPVTPHG